jgi:deoxyguanosine kinase
LPLADIKIRDHKIPTTINTDQLKQHLIQPNEEVILLSGSNEGNRSENLRYAISGLENILGRKALYSEIFVSPPWGFDAKFDFYNQLIIFRGLNISAETLLQHLLSVERAAGRIRDEKPGYRSRTLDIDILYIGHQIIASPALTVPHPRIAERKFVLEPMCALRPDFTHPVTGLTQKEMLDKLG